MVTGKTTVYRLSYMRHLNTLRAFQIRNRAGYLQQPVVLGARKPPLINRGEANINTQYPIPKALISYTHHEHEFSNRSTFFDIGFSGLEVLHGGCHIKTRTASCSGRGKIA